MTKFFVYRAKDVPVTVDITPYEYASHKASVLDDAKWYVFSFGVLVGAAGNIILGTDVNPTWRSFGNTALGIFSLGITFAVSVLHRIESGYLADREEGIRRGIVTGDKVEEYGDDIDKKLKIEATSKNSGYTPTLYKPTERTPLLLHREIPIEPSENDEDPDLETLPKRSVV